MLLKLLLFVAVLCVLLRRSSKRNDTADAALLGHFRIRGRTIKSCKIFWCKIGFRMSVMRSCENIVNGNHVTFFLHSIGLRFFDVEYDWSKNVEINRFKFPTARFVLVQNSIFWKWSDLPFEKNKELLTFMSWF